MLAGAMMQSLMLAGNSGGIALAVDIEMGFTDRLFAAPISRFAIVLGRLAGTAVLGRFGALWFIAIGLIFGATFEAGRARSAADDRAGHRARPLAFGGIGAAIALRTGSASVVQGLFPLVFVILFLSSAFFPPELLLEPAETIAAIQPAHLHRRRHPRAGDLRHRRLRDPSRRCWRSLGSSSIGLVLSALALRRRLRAADGGDDRDPGLARQPGDGRRADARGPRTSSSGSRARRSPACSRRRSSSSASTAVFGGLTPLPGFDTDSYQSFIIPISMLQGAGFTGAATGVNLARDIEQGWFDRLLASPAPRSALLAGTGALGEPARADPRHRSAERRLRDRRRLARRRRALLIALSVVDGDGRRSPPAGASAWRCATRPSARRR